MTADELRSARLLFAAELARGELQPDDLGRPDVASAVRSRPIPAWATRVLQRLAVSRRLLTYETGSASALAAARRAVLGPRAAGEPRLLVRVDEFPHYRALDRPDRYGTGAYAEFHSKMRSANVPYLAAVLPQLARDPLNPHASGGRPLDEAELDMLERMKGDGVAFGLHGLDHRTRDARPRRRSELGGLAAHEAKTLLDRASDSFEALGIRPRVFVPSFNRFDEAQYRQLADRFEVICGGPETVAIFGFHRTPLWRGDAVYMPAYPRLYGRAATILPAAQQLIRERVALWVPVVLHWGWEADDGWRDLEALLRLIAPYACSWSDFLEAVRSSR